MTRPRLATGYPQCQAPDIVVVGRVSTDASNPRVGLLPVDFVPAGASWTSDLRPSPLEAAERGERTEYLWLVSSQVAEAYTAGVEPTDYPSIPGDNDGSGRSVMHLRVKPATAAGARPFVIDLGQSVEFYARQVVVELVAPAGSVVFVPPSGQGTGRYPTPAVGLLFTATVGVRLARLRVSRSVKSALFTESVYVAANATQEIPIPNAAQALTVYAESAASPVMRWVRGGVLDLGVIDWDPLRPRLEIAAPNANTIRILPAVNDRLFSFVWTIAP